MSGYWKLKELVHIVIVAVHRVKRISSPVQDMESKPGIKRKKYGFSNCATQKTTEVSPYV
jgi:hypothetical protein